MPCMVCVLVLLGTGLNSAEEIAEGVSIREFVDYKSICDIFTVVVNGLLLEYT